jgi:hypothetical protein
MSHSLACRQRLCSRLCQHCDAQRAAL